MAKKEDIKNGVNVSFDGGVIINDKSLKEEVKEESAEEVASSGAMAPETVNNEVQAESPASDDLNQIDPTLNADQLASFGAPSYEVSDPLISGEITPTIPQENNVNIVISSPEEWKKYIDDLYRTKPQELVKEEVERIGGKQAELVGYLVKTLNEVADKHGVTTDVHKKLQEINEVDTGKKSVDELLGKPNEVNNTNNFSFPYYGEDDSYSKIA